MKKRFAMKSTNARLACAAVVGFIVALLLIVAHRDPQPSRLGELAPDLGLPPARTLPAPDIHRGTTTNQHPDQPAIVRDAVMVESPSTFYSHPSMPYGVAGFNVFFSLASVNAEPGSSDAAVRRIQQATGVDAETASRLMTYIEEAVEDYNLHFKELKVETCSIRSQLTSMPALVEEMDRTRLAAEHRRVLLLRGSESILGKEGMQRFDLYLSRANERAKFVESDYDTAFRASGRTAQEVLASFCKKLDEGKP